ncbi:hypothetical protein VTJ49DRAFT_992 [Mycothermus thermophilus]|uniref:Fun14 family protein n=1 Tax=Humicola insolens TaxID=85995 RepID=A0ABR3VDJ8_HUMIN
MATLTTTTTSTLKSPTSTILSTLLHQRTLTARPPFRPSRFTTTTPHQTPSRTRTFTTRTNARTQAQSNRPSARLALSLTTGGLLATLHQQRPLKLDTWLSSSPATQQARPFATGENPRRRGEAFGEVVRELSMGSVSGFVAGLLVSVFSKTLVLLAGIGMVVVQVAAKSGIDLVAYLKLKERASVSRILAALNRHAAFKLSFGLAFALSAFMSF